MKTSLPSYARLPINRCNLPPVILGSLTFQHHPGSLKIDGIEVLHKDLFTRLEQVADVKLRAEIFMDYMVVHFRMHQLEDAGVTPGDDSKRTKADYLRLLRGWLFDSDSREGAVLKSWVESRFGLLPRYHKGPLHDLAGNSYQQYLVERASGLFATNALEAQIDLLYSYCQYELAKKLSVDEHLTLYRGVNQLDQYDVLETRDRQHVTVLLNNLNSFTFNRHRADEFGDYIMTVKMPWQKVLFYSELLPGMLKGEEEVVVIGGVYDVLIDY